MTVVLSLGSALAFGLSDFVGGLLARRTWVWAVAVMAQAGSALSVTATALFIAGTPTWSHWAWGAAAGIGSGVGTVLLYRGLAEGRMSVVAPLSAVVAAVLPVGVGVLSGERPSPGVWVGVLCALPAIWLVSRAETTGQTSGTIGTTSRAVRHGVLAGAGFSLLYTGLGQVPEQAGLGPLALCQAVSVLVVVALAVAFAQPWLPRDRFAAGAVTAGLLGGAGGALFLLAAQSGMLTVAVVLSALYPAVTVLMAAMVLRERVSGEQGVGLLFALAAVGLVATG